VIAESLGRRERNSRTAEAHPLCELRVRELSAASMQRVELQERRPEPSLTEARVQETCLYLHQWAAVVSLPKSVVLRSPA